MRFVTDTSKGILGKPDPIDLWQEIIAEIPDKILLKKDLRILFPACGHATEVDLIAKRLLSLGKTVKEVKDSLFLIDKYKVFTKDAIRKGYTHVIKTDYLEYNSDLKFDLIIGSPPYQHESNKSIKLWVNFTVKSYAMLNDNGKLIFITPSTWVRKPIGRTFGKATQLFAENYLETVNLKSSVSNYFSVGEKICYWILCKTKNKKPTQIILDDEIKTQLYTQQPIAITKEQSLYDTISKKLTSSKFTKLKEVYYSDFNYSTKDAVKKGLVSYTETKEHSYPLFVTASQQAFTKPELVKKCLKLIFNCSGYYYKKQFDDKYMLISDSIAVGEAGVGFECKTFEEAVNAKSFFSSKLYVYYIANEKTGGFNTGVLNLPILDTTKKWTDEEVYKTFNLTQEEINLIESTTE